MKEIEDIGGKKWNYLTAIEFRKYNRTNQVWLFRCDCGNEKEIILSKVKINNIKSCGCHRIRILIKRNIKHNLTKHPLYRVWNDIRQRCYNKNRKEYKNYGGRGITICDEWKNDISIFIKWAEENGWKEGLEIDRINNDGNYEPNNCRFVTCIENNNNKRNNKYIEYNGKKQTHRQWEKELNLYRGAIRERLKRNWSIEEILQKAK